MIRNCLTIAGSDPSGGAGIQADLKTFSAHGCYGCAIITSVTAQNTHGVQSAHTIPVPSVLDQLDCLFADVRIDVIKTGMLPTPTLIASLAEFLQGHDHIPLVVDPVMVATSGDRLVSQEAVDTLRECLIPLATVLTPNLPEADTLAQCSPSTTVTDMHAVIHELARLGCASIMLKGGHLSDTVATDLLWDGVTVHELTGPRHATPNTHGTGCSLASAIAAHLAKGEPPLSAARLAKHWLSDAIAQADQLQVGDGGGHGPVHHFHSLWP